MKKINISNGIIAIIFYLIYKVLFEILLSASKLSLTIIDNIYLYGILILSLVIISFAISYRIYNKLNNKKLNSFNVYIIGVVICLILLVLNKYLGDFTEDFVSNNVKMELSQYLEFTGLGYTIWYVFNMVLLFYFGVLLFRKNEPVVSSDF